MFDCIIPDSSPFDNSPPATGSLMHAATHLSCITHPKVTLYTWRVVKIFSSLKGFKAGFDSGTLSGGEGWFGVFFYLEYLIKAVTTKAGCHTYSSMPSLRQLHLPPPVLSQHFGYSLFIQKLLGSEELRIWYCLKKPSNPIYSTVLLRVSKTVRKAGIDYRMIKPDKKGFFAE